VERRTGERRSVFPNDRIWAITVPIPDDLLALSRTEKAAFPEEHETRQLARWQRKEWAWA
jgi:hypothetical protein